MQKSNSCRRLVKYLSDSLSRTKKRTHFTDKKRYCSLDGKRLTLTVAAVNYMTGLASVGIGGCGGLQALSQHSCLDKVRRKLARTRYHRGDTMLIGITALCHQHRELRCYTVRTGWQTTIALKQQGM